MTFKTDIVIGNLNQKIQNSSMKDSYNDKFKE